MVEESPEESTKIQAPSERRGFGSDWAKWLIAAAMLLVVAGGYWGLSLNHRGKLEQARELGEADRRIVEAKPALEPRATEPAQRRAGPERASAEPTRRETQTAAERAEAARKKTEPALQVVAVSPEPPRPLGNAAAVGTGSDGLYIGPICYGPAAAGPPRCFRAHATISQGRIVGQWPGRDPGVTMFMAGDVSPSGEATIRMHSEKPDRTRTAPINLSGTLKNGRLDATGSFPDGRTATLSWRKSVMGSR